MATTNVKTTNVTIIPGKANSIATALRGHVNAVLAYHRMGEFGLMREALTQMQRDAAMLELEVTLSAK